MPTESKSSLPRLDGKRILIAGGAGQVGSALTTICLASGATVVVPSRSEERLKTLRAKLSDAVADRLVPLVGNISDPVGAATLRDAMMPRIDKLDGVIAALGSHWEGSPLMEVSVEDWQRLLGDHLTSHFVMARTFVPVLQQNGKGGIYLFITGPGGEIPSLKSAPISVASAGAKMLARILADELNGTGVRVEDLTYSPTRLRSHWLTIDGLMRETLRILGEGGGIA